MSTTAISFRLPKAASQGFQNAPAYDTHRPHTLKKPSLRYFPRWDYWASKIPRSSRLPLARGSSPSCLPTERRDSISLGKELKGVDVRDGHAGRLAVEDDEWADGYIAAQSFHWFANEETLKEAHRVLKKGRDNKSREWKATTTWEEKLNSWIYSISSDGQPRFRDGQRRSALDNQQLFALLLSEETVKWTVWLSEGALWSRINTLSQVAILEGSDREAAVRVFKEALQSPDVERNEKGEIALHGVTYFVWTKKLDSLRFLPIHQPPKLLSRISDPTPRPPDAVNNRLKLLNRQRYT
ncbi:hypothetical protein QC762_113990 [Podospora pseudocomata]|uniref:Methyltransferase type 11 domain-containing protein n=1 Tax=Podospora pseudocomata TaxID=2093779 RepID=A0ABR0GVP4_9PEZI|nr:hypothetical protein QC762_113990 [Podospora pseudocomata]